MIDERNLFDQPVNNYKKTCYNIQKIATGQESDYTTGFLLQYIYFKENYKLIAINLNRKQKLDANTKAIQQIILLEI